MTRSIAWHLPMKYMPSNYGSVICNPAHNPGAFLSRFRMALNKGFFTGRLRPAVQPFFLLYFILTEKVSLSYSFSVLRKSTPFTCLLIYENCNCSKFPFL